jgi:hypothetical protein
MHDIGPPVQGAGRGADPGGDPRQQAEAPVVVGPVASLRAQVGIARPVEIRRVVEQQQRCAVRSERLLQRRRRQQAAEPVRPGDLLGLRKVLVQSRIGRDQDAHVDAQSTQSRRQRAGDITQTAGLDPWGQLRSCKQDLHDLAAAISPAVELSRPSAGFAPSMMGNSRFASCLPYSTPHWSKGLMSQMTLSTKTLCS